MADIADVHANRLSDIKKNVEEAHTYFKDNYDRYHKFTKFVFETSITPRDQEILTDLQKPDLEFNILESFVSRLRGEFAKQQPSLSVRGADGISDNEITPDFIKTIEIVEQYLRAIFFDASNDKLEYDIYSDLLAGGFSVIEAFTDYINDHSFEQNIYVKRAFDPTLCGFDPLARQSHKGDGRFCFQIYPKTAEEFKDEFGKSALEGFKYSKNIDGFGWSFRDERQEIILVCDYYEKKNKRATLVKLSDDRVMLKSEYKEMIEKEYPAGVLEVPPVIVKKRKTTITTICRYRICENEVLDYKETNFKYFPLIFVDGNSRMINDGDQQSQITRPYVYHAEGIQRLKNFAGQSLANELENLVQHKFIVALESVPDKYMEAYDNVQRMQTLFYHHFQDENSPEVILPPPREVQRPPIPREISDAFRMSDEMTQVILGSYDSVMGTNKLDISGEAIAKGAMQSNNASVPYIVGYIKGINRVAEIILDLIPKYYRTPRTLPVLLPSGKREYISVNNEGGIQLNYDSNSLQVKVETGVNFVMQKEIALKTIVNLMQASPAFAQFINEKGLMVLLDNIDIRGIDALKAEVEDWQKENEQKTQETEQIQKSMAKMQQQLAEIQGKAKAQKDVADAEKAMKEAAGPTDTEVDIMKIKKDAVFDAIEAKQNQQEIDMEMTEMLAQLQSMDVDAYIKNSEIDAEQARTFVDSIHTIAQIVNMNNNS